MKNMKYCFKYWKDNMNVISNRFNQFFLLILDLNSMIKLLSMTHLKV